MISSVGQNNNVQRFSAVNALRSASVPLKQKVEENASELQNVEAPTRTVSKNILDRVDVSDIRKHAGYVGEYDISDEDIKYGLVYGRSVIAEYLC